MYVIYHREQMNCYKFNCFICILIISVGFIIFYVGFRNNYIIGFNKNANAIHF